MANNLNQISGTIFSDIITWVRRIIKSSSNQSISDAIIGDYINRFYVYDMPARLQLFELKRQYTFETIANIFIYQAPRNATTFDEEGVVSGIPQYQTYEPPAYCDGIQMGWYQSNQQFYNIFPEFVNNQQPLQGDGTSGPYSANVGTFPILRGFRDDNDYLTPYVFITTSDGNGNQQYIVDGGDGILYQTDASFQFGPLGPPTDPIVTGTVNYATGALNNFSFFSNVTAGQNIEIQTSPFSSGRPRIALFFNNSFKLYPVPDRAYKIQCDVYLTPAAFLDTADSVTYAYMSDYLARGAARRILSDNADFELLQFYEPFFKEQELQVLRRTERQRANQRTPTIFSASTTQNPYVFTQY